MITSNLKDKGLKIVGGTTLITIPTKKKKGGEKRYRFVQALVCPDTHKALKRLAIDQDISLGELLQEVIAFYLENSKNWSI